MDSIPRILVLAIRIDNLIRHVGRSAEMRGAEVRDRLGRQWRENIDQLGPVLMLRVDAGQTRAERVFNRGQRREDVQRRRVVRRGVVREYPRQRVEVLPVDRERVQCECVADGFDCDRVDDYRRFELGGQIVAVDWVGAEGEEVRHGC